VIDRRQMMAMTAASALAPTIPAGPARGQSAAAWPARPVRLIVPYAPGGPTDAVARLVADSLSRTWGQQVVIENKGGAGTNIGADLVAHSDPDGYTMLIGSGALAINRNLYRTLSYDAVADFAPVVHICGFSFFMLVPVSSSARSVKEFIALAKEHPGKMTFASPGTGSPPHLAGELLKHLTKIELTHVPYRGASPAFTDLIAGRVDLFFGSGISVEQVKAGKLRALAFSGTTRSTALPDVPTVAEAGVPGFEVSSWYGLFVPAKTPAAVVANINAATLKALAEPNVRARLDELGYVIGGSTPGELAALLNSEINKWAPIIKSALEPQ
jgi:tripartite-type tricarboxylate transporter receptor subunit TctC